MVLPIGAQNRSYGTYAICIHISFAHLILVDVESLLKKRGSLNHLFRNPNEPPRKPKPRKKLSEEDIKQELSELRAEAENLVRPSRLKEHVQEYAARVHGWSPEKFDAWWEA